MIYNARAYLAVRSNMESQNQNPFEGFKDAYQRLLDETANFVKQPIESAKEFSSMVIDAQREALQGADESNAMLTPWKSMMAMQYRFLEFYTRQATLGVSMANRAVEGFFDSASAWGRGAKQAQRSFSRGAEDAQKDLTRGMQDAQREMSRASDEATTKAKESSSFTSTSQPSSTSTRKSSP
jgi:hypothetical protein